MKDEFRLICIRLRRRSVLSIRRDDRWQALIVMLTDADRNARAYSLPPVAIQAQADMIMSYIRVAYPWQDPEEWAAIHGVAMDELLRAGVIA